MTKNNLNLILTPSSLRLNNEFKVIFPQLYSLIEKANKFDIEVNFKKRFRQYVWNLKSGSTCGWLCVLEDETPKAIDFIKEHLFLVRRIGGIKSTWNEPYNLISSSKEFIFTLSHCETGIGDWIDAYLLECEFNGVKPIETQNLISFSLEANGDLTLYNKETKEILFFAHDGTENEFKVYLNQPEHTFYHLEKAKTFVEFVEYFALSWLEHIEEN